MRPSESRRGMVSTSSAPESVRGRIAATPTRQGDGAVSRRRAGLSSCRAAFPSVSQHVVSRMPGSACQTQAAVVRAMRLTSRIKEMTSEAKRWTAPRL